MTFGSTRSTRRRRSLRTACRDFVQKLESRTLLSVSTSASGHTVITPGSNDRVIYCSSSTGNDSNSGMSPNSPVQSLSRAESLLRNNTGDEMLLKAGDTWHGSFIYWMLSGASASDPMVLGSYGSGPRPLILSGTKSGFETGSVRAPVVNNVAIMGIEFDADGRDPAMTSNPVSSYAVGINILTKSSNITVENCEVENYTVNLNFQSLMGPQTNISVINNVIVNAWSSNASHSEGIYVSGVNRFTLQGNDIDHNGWNSQIPGAGPTWFNHDTYLSYNNSNCVVTDNIFADAAGYGLQARSGGIVTNNVFIDDPIGMSFGIVTGASTTAGGVTGVVSDNVFIGGANIGSVDEGGGLIVGNIKPGAGVVVSNNIFSQSIPNATAAISVAYGKSQPNEWASVGANDVKIQNNIIYDWTLGIDVQDGQIAGGSGYNALNRITIAGNQFENISGYAFENHSTSYNAAEAISGNSFYNAGTSRQGQTIVKSAGNNMSGPLPFANPNRSIATFASSNGIGGGVGGFLAGAATQSEQNYNSSYNAATIVTYIENGFTGATTPPGGGSTPPGGGSTPPGGGTGTTSSVSMAFNSLRLNGSAAVAGSSLQLTNGGSYQAGSAFTASKVNVSSFTTSFDFQLSAGANIGHGFTFTIQGESPTALGQSAGGLGYGDDYSPGSPVITNSVAVKFDLYSNEGEGNNSTGLFTNGANPTLNATNTDLTPSGINLHSGDKFNVQMSYDGTNLTVTIKDTTTGNSATQTYAINIPTTVGSNMAYVGFTAGTGGLTATQRILDWTFGNS